MQASLQQLLVMPASTRYIKDVHMRRLIQLLELDCQAEVYISAAAATHMYSAVTDPHKLFCAVDVVCFVENAGGR